MQLIGLASMVRDGAHYAKVYLDQCAAFRDVLEYESLKVIVCEGDSRDQSREVFTRLAAERGLDFTLLRKDHGQPNYGSVVDERRFKAKALVGNHILENLPQDLSALIYVECDLLWTPEVFVALLDRLKEVPAVSPMTMTIGTTHYDIWGLTLPDGNCAGPFPPYHPDLKPEGLTRVATTGSCIAMRGELATNPRVRFSPVDEFHGLSRSIYEVGGSIHVDPSLRIYHPA